jgi:hypothetical protein
MTEKCQREEAEQSSKHPKSDKLFRELSHKSVSPQREEAEQSRKNPKSDKLVRELSHNSMSPSKEEQDKNSSIQENYLSGN